MICDVKVSFGTVRGTASDEVRVFRGIPYARYERFHEPVANDSSCSGAILEAVDYGVLCPQRSERINALVGKIKGLSIREGELDISIYAPDDNISSHPVMVWLHGGSYLHGGSEDPRYGAERLVRVGSVVVVKVSYRLGVEGWLYWPERGIANLGLADLRCALGWIQRNIAAFGGDPDNVTLFGQSAGAHLLVSLIATNVEKPSFKRVILQSAPIGIMISASEASEIRKAFLSALGKDIMQATLDELLDAQDAVKKFRKTLTFMPVLEDNTAVPSSVKNLQVFAICAAQDASPYVIPSYRKYFGKSPMLLRALAAPMVAVLTRKIFSSALEQYVSRLAATGVRARSHVIHWHPAGSVMGACHCIELPFLLGKYEDWADALMLNGMTTHEFETLSAQFLSSWTDFARSGKFPELTV